MADQPKVNWDPNSPLQFVSTPVRADHLIRMLKEPKDVRVQIFQIGAVIAHCKKCAEQIQPRDKDELLWLVCDKCKGVSFIPLANLPRDVHFAREQGGVFEYEVFYVRDLPPQLSPPKPPEPPKPSPTAY